MKNKRLKILLILIVIFICVIIFFQKNISKTKSNEDYLFLKFLSKIQKNSNVNYNEKTKIYKFNVRYKDNDLKAINLNDTINKETLIYEKIAPGTSGEFQIELNSNKKLKYQIYFKSETLKPQNLYFKINIKNKNLIETNDLEELEKNLQGNINKDEKISVDVEWYWKFQDLNNLELTDIQDTKDAKEIEQYKFFIHVIGKDVF